MGRIRIARDQRLDRDVAIKELLYDSDDTRLRFEREVRITAKLQHPSIVNVLEAGCWPSGEPFYVMKLVAGESLDRVIARQITIEQRMTLLPHMIHVVEALAFAHSRNVIHRDLKPANVLVGSFGETVVIDWGLARELRDTHEEPTSTAIPAAEAGATVAGAILGTPGYMAPEQADGQVLDARADVYALGGMLFHVLAGRPPVEGRTVEEMLSKVSSGERAKLGDLAPDLPPDLVAIVEKAMSFELAARYPTAKGLADDLRRFEAGQLVGARQYSKWLLLKRWARRHRAVLSVATIALVTVVVLATLGIRRVLAEQRATEKQRVLADRHRVDAEELLSYLLVDVSEKLAKLGNVSLREDVANTVIHYYATHPVESVPDRRRRVAAHQALAAALLDQRDLDRAIVQTNEAIAIATALLATAPGDREVRAVLVDAYDLEARVHVYGGKLDEALVARRQAVLVQEALLRDVPSSLHRRRLATLRVGIAIIHYERGDQQAALAATTPALDELQALVRVERSPEALESTWKALHVLGDLLVRRGDNEAALGRFREARGLAEELVALDAKDVERLDLRSTSNDRIAAVLSYLGRTSEALAAYEEGLEMARALVERDPSNRQWQRSLVVAHGNVAGQHIPQRAYDKAIEHYRAAHAILSRLLSLDERDVLLLRDLATIEIEMTATEFARHHDDAAFAHSKSAVARLERVVEAAPSDALALRLLAKAYDDLGSLYLEKKDARIGVELVHKSLAAAQSFYELDRENVFAMEAVAESAEHLLDLQAGLDDATRSHTAAALRAIHTALLAKGSEYQELVERGRKKLAACCPQ